MRRPRYRGTNPRAFHLKYKELQPDRYAADVDKVLAAGKTPAGMHRPIMVDEILRALTPRPGDVALDCTLGFGGHAQALLERVTPGGRLIGLDVDPIELPRTEARLRAAGFGPDVFEARRTNFAGLLAALAEAGVDGADVVCADLGVSSMQLDNPARGFTFKDTAPLDMRMNPSGVNRPRRCWRARGRRRWPHSSQPTPTSRTPPPSPDVWPGERWPPRVTAAAVRGGRARDARHAPEPTPPTRRCGACSRRSALRSTTSSRRWTRCCGPCRRPCVRAAASPFSASTRVKTGA